MDLGSIYSASSRKSLKPLTVPPLCPRSNPFNGHRPFESVLMNSLSEFIFWIYRPKPHFFVSISHLHTPLKPVLIQLLQFVSFFSIYLWSDCSQHQDSHLDYSIIYLCIQSSCSYCFIGFWCFPGGYWRLFNE